MEVDRHAVRFVVVGIGININMTQADLDRYLGPIAPTATSLQATLGYEMSREGMNTAMLMLKAFTPLALSSSRGAPSVERCVPP